MPRYSLTEKREKLLDLVKYQPRKIYDYILRNKRRSKEVWFNKLCEDLGIPRPTIKKYIEAFEEIGIIEMKWSRKRLLGRYSKGSRKVHRSIIKWVGILEIIDSPLSREYEGILYP